MAGADDFDLVPLLGSSDDPLDRAMLRAAREDEPPSALLGKTLLAVGVATTAAAVGATAKAATIAHAGATAAKLSVPPASAGAAGAAGVGAGSVGAGSVGAGSVGAGAAGAVGAKGLFASGLALKLSAVVAVVGATSTTAYIALDSDPEPAPQNQQVATQQVEPQQVEPQQVEPQITEPAPPAEAEAEQAKQDTPDDVEPPAEPDEVDASIPTDPGASGAQASVGSTPVAPSPPKPKSTLGDEVALLDAARNALLSGDANRCLSLVDSYRAKYPEGALKPEADALRIAALADLGQQDAAAQAASEFQQDHPTSPLSGKVDAIANPGAND